MCSTCNYKNFEVVEHKIYDKVERKLEQKLGIAEKLIIRCDMDGTNYKMAVDGEPKSEFVIYRCPTCGHKLY